MRNKKINQKNLLIVIILFLSVNFVFSEEKEESKKVHQSIRGEQRFASPDISFYKLNNDSYYLNLCTEGFASGGLEYNYNNYSIGLILSSLKIWDISLSWFGAYTGVNFFYQNHKNYYIAEDNSNEKKYPDIPNEYPEMTVKNFGLSFYYFFYDNSIQGLNSQREELIKNNWSPLIKTTIGYFNINNNSPIIPEADRYLFHEDIQNFSYYENYYNSISGGITGTFIYRGFYISAMLTAGLSIYYDTSIVH